MDGGEKQEQNNRITSAGISCKTAASLCVRTHHFYFAHGSAKTGGCCSSSCKAQTIKQCQVGLCIRWVLSACSALCIPAPCRSIRCLSVKVVSNSYHHKRWEQTEKTTTADIPEIFLPSALHRCGKMLLHAHCLVRKSTQVFCHTGLNSLNRRYLVKTSRH